MLRRILRLAADWGVIESAAKIELLAGETRREPVVTPEEEARYLATAHPLLAEVAGVLFDANLIHCRSPFYLCLEHVDNLGEYTASRLLTALLVSSGYDNRLPCSVWQRLRFDL